jgi:hypothetical protein
VDVSELTPASKPMDIQGENEIRAETLHIIIPCLKIKQIEKTHNICPVTFSFKDTRHRQMAQTVKW